MAEVEWYELEEPICNYSLSHHRRVTLDIVRGSVAVASTVFLIISILIPCCKKRYNIYNFRLVLYQLLSSLFYSLVTVSQITAIWYKREGNSIARLCKAVGFGLMYSNWTVVLFKFYILLEVLYFAAVEDKRKTLVRTTRKEIIDITIYTKTLPVTCTLFSHSQIVPFSIILIPNDDHAEYMHRLIEHCAVTSMPLLYCLTKQNLGFLKKMLKDLD